MAINKLQMSRLTFDLSAKELILESHQYIKTKFSQKPLDQLSSNFIWRLAKIYANWFGHMTKMADMPIYDKNPLKIFFYRTRRLMTFELGT